MSLNFKNPQGRILRRQWTSKVKGMPSYQDWLKVKEDVEIPNEVFNIPIKNLSGIRQTEKWCFPFDNSVIRVQKNYVGGRRFGTNMIVKDNLIFGIKES